MNNTVNIINDNQYHRSSTYCTAVPILHPILHGILLQQHTKDEYIPLTVRAGVVKCSGLIEQPEQAVKPSQPQRTFDDITKFRG